MEEDKTLNNKSKVILKVCKVITFFCLAFTAASLYLLNDTKSAAIVGGSLCLFVIFNWLDALSRPV